MSVCEPSRIRSFLLDSPASPNIARNSSLLPHRLRQDTRRDHVVHHPPFRNARLLYIQRRAPAESDNLRNSLCPEQIRTSFQMPTGGYSPNSIGKRCVCDGTGQEVREYGNCFYGTEPRCVLHPGEFITSPFQRFIHISTGNLKTRVLRHCGPLYTFFIVSFQNHPKPALQLLSISNGIY
jgi:hypothetical protein